MRILATILLLCGLSFAQGTELLRPTMDVTTGATTSWSNTYCGIGTFTASSSMPLSYDNGGLTTSSSSTTSAASIRKVTARLFSSWTSTSNSYTALTLNVSARLSGNDGGSAAVVYSTDSGTTYTRIGIITSAQATYTVAINSGQDLSKLRIGACATAVGLDPGTGVGTVQVYDIWTSGTLGSPAAGSGSSAGTAIQPVQFN